MSAGLFGKTFRTISLMLVLLFIVGCGVPLATPTSSPADGGLLVTPVGGRMRPPPALRGTSGSAQVSPAPLADSATQIPTSTLVPTLTPTPTLPPSPTLLAGSGACTSFQPEGTEGPIWDIAVASDGTVWVAAFRGVARYNPNLRTWTPYTMDDGLVSDQVQSITVEPDGSVWFAYRGQEGASHFDGTRWSHVTTDDGLISDDVKSISIAPDGSVWFATAGGASRWDRELDQWTFHTKAEGLHSNNVRKIVFTSDGTIWFAHNEALTYLELPDSEDGQPEWGIYGESRVLPTRKALVSQDGRLWLGQVYRDPETQQWVETVYREIHVQGLAVDGQGGLWIGREDGALYIADPVSTPRGAWLRYDTSVGLVDDNVQVIALEADDVVWFGTEGGASRCVLDAVVGPGGTPSPSEVTAAVSPEPTSLISAGSTPEPLARGVAGQPFAADHQVRRANLLFPPIAYTQLTETGDDLFLLDLASEPAVVSRRTDTAGSAYAPRWSPDGQSIAYYYQDAETGRVDLWIVGSTEGAPARSLTEGDLREMGEVSWSADSRYLVFHAVVPDGIDHDIVRLDIETGEYVNLTADSPAWDRDPRWSPDGAWIALVSDRVAGTGRGQDSIWRMVPDGSDLTQVTGSDWEDVRPGWSPDWDEIAFYRWSFLDLIEGGPSGLWVTRADGSEERLLIELDVLPTGFDAPAWSPDGRWIAYQAGLSNNADLYVVPAGGGSPMNISALPGHDYAASWSPDSRFLLFTNSAEGEVQLFVADVEGDGLWALLEVPGNRLGVWAPVTGTTE
jgi:Tol biopolymer transport system component/streptogramin lyase